jgi:hypothetical protein
MEMAQRGELAQLEAQVKEMQSARDREVQIATSEFAPMLSKIVTPFACAWYGRVNLYSVRGHHLCGCGCRLQGHLDLCARCVDLSAVTMVLGYYFGSSAGSKEKSAQLDDIMEKKK